MAATQEAFNQHKYWRPSILTCVERETETLHPLELPTLFICGWVPCCK